MIDLPNKPRPADSIAVLGSSRSTDLAQITAGFRIGCAIASNACHLVTGATSGVPYAAALGAKRMGGFVVGISPAANLEEHIGRYRKPLRGIDVIVYTGMGLEGRNTLNVRSAKGAIFVGGEFGTMAEFSAAWTIGNNVLGVLEGVGGATDVVRDLVGRFPTRYGSEVIFGTCPETLANSVCQMVCAKYGSRKDPDLYCDLEVERLIEEYLSETGLS